MNYGSIYFLCRKVALLVLECVTPYVGRQCELCKYIFPMWKGSLISFRMCHPFSRKTMNYGSIYFLCGKVALLVSKCVTPFLGRL